MGDVHQLLLKNGIEGARRQADTAADRVAVEAAAAIMAEEEIRLGVTHAGFAMTALPHRRIEESIWKRETPLTTLVVASGHDRKGCLVGVPYGSLARLILIYLQTEAIRTCSPEVELGRSMNAWLTRMAIVPGGRTRSLVSEQARRISSCRLTFFSDRGNVEMQENGAFVRTAISMVGVADDQQPALWQDRVRLDDGFFRSLREHPVPVREEAVRAIGQRSMAIDVYVWLAYRLHALSRPTKVSWPAIFSQFGAGFGMLKHLKPRFTDALKVALAVYPEARVEADSAGLVLHPSAPAVPKAEARLLGL
jgi:hypothetical protein